MKTSTRRKNEALIINYPSKESTLVAINSSKEAHDYISQCQLTHCPPLTCSSLYLHLENRAPTIPLSFLTSSCSCLLWHQCFLICSTCLQHNPLLSKRIWQRWYRTLSRAEVSGIASVFDIIRYRAWHDIVLNPNAFWMGNLSHQWIR